jgi:glucose/arabinose dehydrogenase
MRRGAFLGHRAVDRRLATAALALFAAVLLLATTAGAAKPKPSGAHSFLAETHSGAATLTTAAQASRAATVPSGFQESTVFSGLTQPTAVRFAPDGRVFVAEQSGLIKVFDSLSDTTPTVFADLRGEVDNYWDRGLLGLALDPNFPATPYVYVLYTYDAPPGQTAPVWNDACPNPPGPNTDGCVVTGHLSRLTASGDTMTGSEQVLLSGWCQQFPSHSIGDLEFGPDGALYVSGGDGASFTNDDYGQFGSASGSPTVKNPCGDPPAGIGGTQSPPTAEGGASRSISLHRVAGPTVLNGTILRLDPATGAALPDNPLAGSSDPIARRIVAEGLRNPFRFTMRPGTNDLWIGDVGENTWEEINRQPAPTSAVANFGWPCYEGAAAHGSYQALGLNICTNLYNANTATPPYYAYNHGAHVAAGDGCATGSSSITGITFYRGGSYPSAYDGALFFADHARNCIWVMFPGANGLPDAGNPTTFLSPGSGPVDLEIGPGGDLFYAGYDTGTIQRIQYFSANQPPVAVATASPTSGAAPLDVAFDASGSHDPDAGNTITYSWDLDGNGVYGDSTSPTPSHTYTTPGAYSVRVRVTDSQGATTTSQPITISANNTPPTPVIDTPADTLKWKVGDPISFSGHASDEQDGTEPAARLSWQIIIHHCPSNCHTHIVQTMPGVASGSFPAPDHEYPSYLELQLTGTDADGLSNSTSINLNPQTVDLTFQSNPPGMQLGAGIFSGTAPFTRTVIVNSNNTISAPNQTLNGTPYVFSAWSDNGVQSHEITAPATPQTYTATFAPGTASACPCSLWGGSTTPGTVDSGEGSALELGVRFQSDKAGFITGLRFYKSAANTGTHVGHLWSATGTPLANATFSGETASGWQQVSFASPVAITANTTYVASYSDPNGHFSLDRPFFTNALDNPPLHALADSNGVYAAGTGNFPTNSFNATNYWVDVVFDTTTNDTTPPTVSSTTPANNAGGVPISAKVSATFSEAMDASTITGTTFQLKDAGGNTVAGSVAYDPAATTATLTPSASLTAGATYTATVKGGAPGVKDAAGNALAADRSWSFTTATPSACPCSLWGGSTTPGTVDSGEGSALELGVRFQSDKAGFITGLRFYKSAANTGTHVGHLWSATGTPLANATFSGETASGWQQVSFASPVAITANTTYVASYSDPNGHFSLDRPFFTNALDNPPLHALADSNGVYAAGTGNFPTNSFNATNYWVDVVFSTS